MTDHPELIELAELYPLGGLSPEERLRLAVHVADGCVECESVLRAHTRIADDLLLAVPPVQPSASVRTELMERVKNEARATAAPQRMAPPPLPLRRAPSALMRRPPGWCSRSVWGVRRRLAGPSEPPRTRGWARSRPGRDMKTARSDGRPREAHERCPLATPSRAGDTTSLAGQGSSRRRRARPVVAQVIVRRQPRLRPTVASTRCG
jgi:hypothetical protein